MAVQLADRIRAIDEQAELAASAEWRRKRRVSGLPPGKSAL